MTDGVASHISEEMRDLVGRVMTTATSFPITTSDIRRWAAAVYYPEVPPRLFWDEEYAAATPFGGIVAPDEFNPFAIMTREPPPARRDPPRPGRFERAFGVEPPASRAVLQGEIRVRYTGTRMRPGDVIRSTQRIAAYSEREGRMGLQLYTTISNEYVNQLDQSIKTLETVYVRY